VGDFMKITEADFQQTVIDLAKFLGYRVAHFRGVRIQRKDGSVYYQTPVQADGAGWPDLVLARPGRLIFAEIKGETGKLSQEQMAWLNILDAAGGECYCWRPSEFEDIETILTRRIAPNKLETILTEV
jgi:hypothetical protein